MAAAIAKEDMLRKLPIREAELTVRSCTRQDLDTLARWPKYPWPYEAFALGFAGLNPAERDQLFEARVTNPCRLTLVADHARQACVGYLALVQIDWSSGVVGNMAFRIAPSWCDRGVGTQMMRNVSGWYFHGGLSVLRLDVAASNLRAIRCYEKAGFAKTQEFWRRDESLKHVDLKQPQYEFLRPHARLHGEAPRLRFFWMELRSETG